LVTEIAMTMKRNGGVVNELTFNVQLTVNLSVFSRLQSCINSLPGFAAPQTTMPVERRTSRVCSECNRGAR
jgi:hypothetical protein